MLSVYQLLKLRKLQDYQLMSSQVRILFVGLQQDKNCLLRMECK